VFGILLILILPVLLAFATVQTHSGEVAVTPLKYNIGWLTGGAMAFMFAVLFAIGYQPVIVEQGAAVFTLEWVPQYNLNLSFYIDSLSLLFGLIVTGIGAIVFLYAGFYFDDVEERTRFIRLLLLFAGAMLWLVLSGNLITLFIAWELTSITSFLLIGFKGNKYESARAGAARALVVTGGGGLALLAGILLLGAAGGTYELSELLNTSLTSDSWYIAITLLIMLGAFTKSAQFPFHFWLPGAMDAPTPASSYLHSATMVKAGVYLLARLHPVLGDTGFWNVGLMSVGLTTMALSALLAVRQADLKGVLAFTTTSWLGALVALLGVPGGYGIKAAMVGILAHALYKSALFLCVGSIDHAVGTRLVSKLGGMWRYMPITGVVVIISSLSMAGIPPLLGFVAKETLLEAVEFNTIILGIVFVSAALTATAGYILVWDVFFAKPKADHHFHELHKPLEWGPVVLATGTVIIALFVTPLITPLITPIVPVEFGLYLFPGFNAIFWLSVAAIISGLALFFLRNPWRSVPDFPFSATYVYNHVIGGLEWTADQVLKTQNGKLRHYLIIILSVSMAILLYGGLASGILKGDAFALGGFRVSDVLDIMMLLLAVVAALVSVRVQRHLHAALALAVFGYAIGGIFLVEPAPDVALVQFLVDTLATVVLIIMISRVGIDQREEAMQALRRSLNTPGDRFARVRDVAIAVVTGLSMGAFALTALTNRANRDSIAQWHLDNAEPEVGVTDVVSAILTDFRGTDTLIEIAVFATCALGLLALLTISREEGGEPNDVIEALDEDSFINTPMTRVMATFVLPLTLVIAFIHVLYGANAPGDGFTAGIVAGLGVAMYYIVFGYESIRDRMTWARPARLLTAGLLLALTNALIPMLFGGAFMGLIDYAPWLDVAGLKFTTTIVFEIAIALTVFGGVGLIMEAIARPASVEMVQSSAPPSGAAAPVTTGQDPLPSNQ
jgi:NADH:ubiquinone oxidoreductase subunit 5 (subunit L)/multisubunit Na+/H+ antiporter MnhA subunit/multisubunit Na+/H+ antiporter MnhB subunit